MTTHNTSGARHRADVRPRTFLSDVSCSAVARRGSMGLAATGLAMGLVVPTASAFDPGPSPEPATTTSTASTSSSGSTADSTSGSTYTVQAGDTVGEIARSQGSSISGIIAANGLNAQALIFPGDELTIPGGSGSNGQASTADRAVQTASRSGERTEQVSAVQASTTSASSNGILAEARQHIGTPYAWGGSTPGAFDCSGFTQYVFAQNGIDIPRTTDAQRNAGTQISQSEARPGDLVWWPGHVGIYTGDGNHIAARSPGTALHESPIYMANPTFIRVS